MIHTTNEKEVLKYSTKLARGLKISVTILYSNGEKNNAFIIKQCVPRPALLGLSQNDCTGGPQIKAVICFTALHSYSRTSLERTQRNKSRSKTSSTVILT